MRIVTALCDAGAGGAVCGRSAKKVRTGPGTRLRARAPACGRSEETAGMGFSAVLMTMSAVGRAPDCVRWVCLFTREDRAAAAYAADETRAVCALSTARPTFRPAQASLLRAVTRRDPDLVVLDDGTCVADDLGAFVRAAAEALQRHPTVGLVSCTQREGEAPAGGDHCPGLTLARGRSGLHVIRADTFKAFYYARDLQLHEFVNNSRGMASARLSAHFCERLRPHDPGATEWRRLEAFTRHR